MRFFCFVLFLICFSLMSSAACCLTGVLLTVLPRLLLSAAVGAGERSWAALASPGAPGGHAFHNVSWTLRARFTAGFAFEKQTQTPFFLSFFFFFFAWERMLRWHLACCLYWKVLIKSCAWRCWRKRTTFKKKTLAVLVGWKDWYPLSFLQLNYNQYFCIHYKSLHCLNVKIEHQLTFPASLQVFIGSFSSLFWYLFFLYTEHSWVQ